LRLGLPTIASDLNPVAVFITRVLIELAPKQAYRSPINPRTSERLIQAPQKFQGLKDDVAYYGELVAAKLKIQLGQHYPEVSVPRRLGGGRAEVVAWIWARTVKCPNPACHAETPLVNKFWLSTHKGNEAYVKPIFHKDSKSFTFLVCDSGEPPEGTVNRSGAICVACRNPVTFEHIRSEGTSGRMGYNLMAMAVDGPGRRVYVAATEEHGDAAKACIPIWKPETELPESALGFRVQRYGITRHSDLFTNRQMTMLASLSELIREIRQEIVKDSKGDVEYANLIHAFLALSLSRVAQTNNALVRWLVRKTGTSKGTPAFDRQIVSMCWEFSEGNIFGTSVGSWKAAIRNPLTALNSIPSTNVGGLAIQHDATASWSRASHLVVSTDPPYYDAIGYSDLSDFFYIWLRRAVMDSHGDIFGTMLTPKTQDMTRDLGRRQISKTKANQQFLERLNAAFKVVCAVASHDAPLTVYYAFKQAEVNETGEDEPGSSSTGWETLLESLFRSGFQITGTWPLRTESTSRLRAIDSNALAASIVLVCRQRPVDAATATRRELIEALKTELPPALVHFQKSNIAPVDLAQAALGPGMKVYTRYAQVVDAAGNPVTVGNAINLINQTLDEVLAEQEGDFDVDTRWAVAWFEQQGFAEGEFGVAEMLSKAKNTSIGGMVQAGILSSKRGKVRLLKPVELADDWDPADDARLPAWEMVHQLIRALEAGGEPAAALLVAQLGSKADIARDLAYRLYTIAERKKRAAEALSYNTLVQSWPEITRLARSEAVPAEPIQAALL
jgi:putative DNA methylase